MRSDNRVDNADTTKWFLLLPAHGSAFRMMAELVSVFRPEQRAGTACG
jgi:hypothetical protein